MSLCLVPIGLRAANEFVDLVHRHHGPTRGHKFSIAVEDDQTGTVHAVAIAGRPVARMLDNGRRLEVLRLATDGTEHVASMLYAAVARAGQAMGYHRPDIFTYTLAHETGVSLLAAGWVCIADVEGRSWDRPKRSRTDRHPTCDKRRWHASMPAVWPMEMPS